MMVAPRNVSYKKSRKKKKNHRKAALSIAGALSLFPVHAEASLTVPEDEIVTNSASIERCTEQQIIPLLEPGEAIDSILCLENQTLALTDRRLIIINRMEENLEEVSFFGQIITADMTDIISENIIDWTCSENTCFFLTEEDHSITLIPTRERAEQSESYVLEGEISDANMIHYRGFLFIAPVSDEMLILSFSNGIEAGVFQIPEYENTEFSIRENRLFIGENEITTDGDCIDNIRFIR